MEPAHYNGKFQLKMTLRNQPQKNMYTEHKQTNVQTTTRQTKLNSKKLCTEEPRNKIQPILTPAKGRVMDNQDQNTQHKKKNYKKKIT